MNEYDEYDEYINDELLNSNSEQYFYFLSNNTIYAIPALSVNEIIEYQPITKAPLLNSYVLGITNVRGSIIPVIDLFDRFENQTTIINNKTSLVIVNTVYEDISYDIAILVDEIFEVDGLDDNSVSKVPSFGTKIKTEFIKEVAKYDNKEIYILDIGKVLNISELSLLSVDENQKDDSLFVREVKPKKYEINDDFDDEDDEDDADDEIDIAQLVSTSANDANQYLVFKGPNEQYYAKNISKIEELLVLKDISIQQNFDDNIIAGTANIRGEMLTLVNFDKWLGLKEVDDSVYEEVIVVNIGKREFGLIIRETKEIITIETKDMFKSSDADSQSTFISNIMLDGKEVLCTIADSDKIILDVFSSELEQSEDDLDNICYTIDSKKIVLFADDSALIRNTLKKTAKNLKVKYKIYGDGEQLYDNLQQLSLDDIGLIVTDLEMPKLDGKELVKRLREDIKYDDIDIVVYTNMANQILEKELLDMGASKVVAKIDIASLSQAILEHIK